MNEVINFILSLLFLIVEVVGLAIILILDNIDEFVEWCNKKTPNR